MYYIAVVLVSLLPGVVEGFDVAQGITFNNDLAVQILKNMDIAPPGYDIQVETWEMALNIVGGLATALGVGVLLNRIRKGVKLGGKLDHVDMNALPGAVEDVAKELDINLPHGKDIGIGKIGPKFPEAANDDSNNIVNIAEARQARYQNNGAKREKVVLKATGTDGPMAFAGNSGNSHASISPGYAGPILDYAHNTPNIPNRIVGNTPRMKGKPGEVGDINRARIKKELGVINGNSRGEISDTLAKIQEKNSKLGRTEWNKTLQLYLQETGKKEDIPQETLDKLWGIHTTKKPQNMTEEVFNFRKARAAIKLGFTNEEVRLMMRSKLLKESDFAALLTGRHSVATAVSNEGALEAADNLFRFRAVPSFRGDTAAFDKHVYLLRRKHALEMRFHYLKSEFGNSDALQSSFATKMEEVDSLLEKNEKILDEAVRRARHNQDRDLIDRLEKAKYQAVSIEPIDMARRKDGDGDVSISLKATVDRQDNLLIFTREEVADLLQIATQERSNLTDINHAEININILPDVVETGDLNLALHTLSDKYNNIQSRFDAQLFPDEALSLRQAYEGKVESLKADYLKFLGNKSEKLSAEVKSLQGEIELGMSQLSSIKIKNHDNTNQIKFDAWLIRMNALIKKVKGEYSQKFEAASAAHSDFSKASGQYIESVVGLTGGPERLIKQLKNAQSEMRKQVSKSNQNSFTNGSTIPRSGLGKLEGLFESPGGPGASTSNFSDLLVGKVTHDAPPPPSGFQALLENPPVPHSASLSPEKLEMNKNLNNTPFRVSGEDGVERFVTLRLLEIEMRIKKQLPQKTLAAHMDPEKLDNESILAQLTETSDLEGITSDEIRLLVLEGYI